MFDTKRYTGNHIEWIVWLKISLNWIIEFLIFMLIQSKNKNLNNENKVIITSMTNNFKGNNLYIANIDWRKSRFDPKI